MSAGAAANVYCLMHSVSLHGLVSFFLRRYLLTAKAIRPQDPVASAAMEFRSSEGRVTLWIKSTFVDTEIGSVSTVRSVRQPQGTIHFCSIEGRSRFPKP